METFSALLAICAGNSPVPGEFPTQRPVTRSFDVYLDMRPNKHLSKQSWGWWFETLSHPLWRHRNVTSWTNVATWLHLSCFLTRWRRCSIITFANAALCAAYSHNMPCTVCLEMFFSNNTSGLIYREQEQHDYDCSNISTVVRKNNENGFAYVQLIIWLLQGTQK